MLFLTSMCEYEIEVFCETRVNETNGRILIQNGSGISRATLYGVFKTAMIF